MVVTTAAAARRQSWALLALFAGALGIASSGIFVRLSQTGPIATGFWRGALALPFLIGWALFEARPRGTGGVLAPLKARDRRILWAGVFFAGDLALWHWSLLLTSVAASTLEANLAPILVTLIAWIVWGERPRPRFVAALGLAVAGLLLIVAPKLATAQHGSLRGDLLGLGTAGFYAGYIIVIARLRSAYGTGVVMLWTTLVFTLLLLPVAGMEKFLPDDAHGWLLLFGLALIAQFFGQGLIAYALAHLPPTFGSIGLYVQPVASACYAWVLLGEQLAAIQIAGIVIVLGAIALARSAQRG
jgi:drug/metabolite transporter (DMT)-like permease